MRDIFNPGATPLAPRRTITVEVEYCPDKGRIGFSAGRWQYSFPHEYSAKARRGQAAFKWGCYAKIWFKVRRLRRIDKKAAKVGAKRTLEFT